MSAIATGAWKPAIKSAAKARIAIYGVGGSGKSLSALMIARGLVGKDGTIAVLDTEGGTASIYADRFEFSTIVMNAPFSTTRFRDAVDNATAAGFDCLIVDGISPFWDGPGGVLEIVDNAKKRGGGWADGTPAQQVMQQAISTCPIHIILTMRAKSDTVIEMVNGKATPRKVGMKYVQRDSIEYEVSWLFYADKDHSLTIDKQRGMDDLDGITIGADTHQRPEPAEQLGAKIRSWLLDGVGDPVVKSAAPRQRVVLDEAPAQEKAAEDNPTPSDDHTSGESEQASSSTDQCRDLLKSRMPAQDRKLVKESCLHLGIAWDESTPAALVERFGDDATDSVLLRTALADAIRKGVPAVGEAEGEVPFVEDPAVVADDKLKAEAFQQFADGDEDPIGDAIRAAEAGQIEAAERIVAATK